MGEYLLVLCRFVRVARLLTMDPEAVDMEGILPLDSVVILPLDM
jgi:hypothetical protein